MVTLTVKMDHHSHMCRCIHVHVQLQALLTDLNREKHPFTDSYPKLTSKPPPTHTYCNRHRRTDTHTRKHHTSQSVSFLQKLWLSSHIIDSFEPDAKSRSRILQWIIHHDHWADDYCLQVWTGLVKFYFFHRQAEVGRIFFNEGCMCSLQSHTTYGPSTLPHLPQICLGDSKKEHAHSHMSNVTSLFVTDQCDSSQLLQWTLHAENEMSLHNWQNVKIQLPSKEPK